MFVPSSVLSLPAQITGRSLSSTEYVTASLTILATSSLTFENSLGEAIDETVIVATSPALHFFAG